MRAGIALSALSHAGLIALAVWTLPWLRVEPGLSTPSVAVTLVSDADLADLARAAAPPPAPPQPEPSPKQVARTPALPPGATLPRPEPVNDPKDDLVPAFDPEAPFGLGIDATGDASRCWRRSHGRWNHASTTRRSRARTDPTRRSRPRRWPRPSRRPSSFLRRRRHPPPPRAGRRHHRAPLRGRDPCRDREAKVYPDEARERGIEGAAQREISVAPRRSSASDQLLRSSGDPQLDAAALGAARDPSSPPRPPLCRGRLPHRGRRFVRAHIARNGAGSRPARRWARRPSARPSYPTHPGQRQSRLWAGKIEAGRRPVAWKNGADMQAVPAASDTQDCLHRSTIEPAGRPVYQVQPPRPPFPRRQ